MAEVHSLFKMLMVRKNRACLHDKENGIFMHKDFGRLCLEPGQPLTQAPNEESDTLYIPTVLLALACPMLSLSSFLELISPMEQS